MAAQVPVPNPRVAVFLGYYIRNRKLPDGSTVTETVAGISRMGKHVMDFIGATPATPAQLKGADIDPADFVNPPLSGGYEREGTLHGKTAVVKTSLTDTKNKTDQFKTFSFPVPEDFPNSFVSGFLTNLNDPAGSAPGAGKMLSVKIDQGRRYSIGQTPVTWTVPDPPPAA